METWFAADGLTVTMMFTCLFVDTQNLFMPLFVQNYKLAIAIDSRLSPAKVRWRQPAVSSELSLVTAS